MQQSSDRHPHPIKVQIYHKNVYYKWSYLDSRECYIWEELAWKDQAFDVQPTILTSTDYWKKKHITITTHTTKSRKCIIQYKTEKKKRKRYLSTSWLVLIWGDAVLEGEKLWLYKPDIACFRPSILRKRVKWGSLYIAKRRKEMSRQREKCFV